MAEKAQPFQRCTSLDADADGAQSLCRSQVHTAVPCTVGQSLSLLGEHRPAATLGPQGCQGRPGENVAFCSSQISCPGF